MKTSPLSLEMKKACCNTCLLSEKMKDCKNCPFNVLPKTDTPKDDRPQYLTALSNARQCCNAVKETVILFYDEDQSPDYLDYCTLTEWERMLDNGQVEESWIFGDMNPA